MISIKLCIPCPVCPQEALANGRLGCHGARRSQCLGPKGGTHRDTTLGTQVKIHSHLYGGFTLLYIVFWSSVFFYMIVWKFIGLHIWNVLEPLRMGFPHQKKLKYVGSLAFWPIPMRVGNRIWPSAPSSMGYFSTLTGKKTHQPVTSRFSIWCSYIYIYIP